jgi:hypothetical protein
MEHSSKTGDKKNLDSISASSPPPKLDILNRPRMLTPSEIESLRQSKREFSVIAKAEFDK